MSAADVITSRTCEGCGQPFEQHDGIIVTCKKLHAARLALESVKDQCRILSRDEIYGIVHRGLDESLPAAYAPPEEDE